jgi:hypothetical protein
VFASNTGIKFMTLKLSSGNGKRNSQPDGNGQGTGENPIKQAKNGFKSQRRISKCDSPKLLTPGISGEGQFEGEENLFKLSEIIKFEKTIGRLKKNPYYPVYIEAIVRWDNQYYTPTLDKITEYGFQVFGSNGMRLLNQTPEAQLLSKASYELLTQ